MPLASIHILRKFLQENQASEKVIQALDALYASAQPKEDDASHVTIFDSNPALQGQLEFCHVINVVNFLDIRLVYVVVVIDFTETVLCKEAFGEGCLVGARHFRALQDLVEDVEVAFEAELEANARFF